jgi:hypothetical protein
VDWIESQVITLEPPSTGRMKIDGNFEDWAQASTAGVVAQVDDPQDMADSSGDIKRVQATVENGNLFLRMAVQGIALPSVEQTPEGMNNRYYYHWLLDTDNNPATGRSNAEYEGTPTDVQKPIGADLVVMIGWRDGTTNGTDVYYATDDEHPFITSLDFRAAGDSVEVRIPLADLNLAIGQTIALSAFQEGASDGWAVDWIESTVMTLTEGGPSGMTLNTSFTGDAYGFDIKVEDSPTMQVDLNSIQTKVDGQAVTASAVKNQGITTITGRNPALLPPQTMHTVSLSLTASGKPQAKDFVFQVGDYSVLPTTSSLNALDRTKTGFLVHITQISTEQSGIDSLHSNLAQLAEIQLKGQFTNEATGVPYYNEAENDWSQWMITPYVAQGVINWYELAPDLTPTINFGNDETIPHLPGAASLVGGVVVELLAYLELPAGYHKLALCSEGGHKVNAGLDAGSPVISLFDNSELEGRVPSYYARNLFFDVVAPETGFYPFRILWFQARRNQESGLLLELLNMKDQALHLVNNVGDAKSVRAFRAGALLGSSSATPTAALRRTGNNVLVEWRGMLQSANSITGPWSDYADEQQSPLTLDPAALPTTFLRARKY